jgi:hypothetical protein
MMTLAQASVTVRLVAALARIVPWARIVPNMAAKRFGVMTFNRVRPETKDFKDNSGNVVFGMTQAWISNRTRIDYREVRCMIEWRRRGGGQFDGMELDGLWLKKIASGLGSYPGVEEKTDLPSNGEAKHLGVLVHNASTGKAYAVCTGTYYAGAQYPNYEHPSFELVPGVYDVTINAFGVGGQLGRLQLETHIGGGSSRPITLAV